MDPLHSNPGPRGKVQPEAPQPWGIYVQRAECLIPLAIAPCEVVQPLASQAWVVGMHALRIDLDVPDTRAVNRTQRLQKSTHAVDGTEAEGVLGEERSAVCFVVESTAGLQQIYSHSTRHIALGGTVFRNRLDDGAISGEAKVEYKCAQLLRFILQHGVAASLCGPIQRFRVERDWPQPSRQARHGKQQGHIPSFLRTMGKSNSLFENLFVSRRRGGESPHRADRAILAGMPLLANPADKCGHGAQHGSALAERCGAGGC
ncbi:hypothetical protein OPT61_g10630 [Boeremia exigua]|uniref:Uncharacterized protein n=1 Tax=Boeremia exigua TaxID=749465 RepID=A0ACC2HPB8_9PLEO|nr:hypothetical protein OPT61_g10630 [Boeremia exigua]